MKPLLKDFIFAQLSFQFLKITVSMQCNVQTRHTFCPIVLNDTAGSSRFSHSRISEQYEGWDMLNSLKGDNTLIAKKTSRIGKKIMLSNGKVNWCPKSQPMVVGHLRVTERFQVHVEKPPQSTKVDRLFVEPDKDREFLVRKTLSS